MRTPFRTPLILILAFWVWPSIALAKTTTVMHRKCRFKVFDDDSCSLAIAPKSSQLTAQLANPKIFSQVSCQCSNRSVIRSSWDGVPVQVKLTAWR